MIIECGPRWPRPGRDWRITTVCGERRVVSIAEDSTYREEMFCDAVARWLGFEVVYGEHGGFITNWDDVPHLWEVADAEP